MEEQKQQRATLDETLAFLAELDKDPRAIDALAKGAFQPNLTELTLWQAYQRRESQPYRARGEQP